MALISGKKVSTSLLVLAACVLGVGIGLFALNYRHATKYATEMSPDDLIESLNRQLLQSESQVYGRQSSENFFDFPIIWTHGHLECSAQQSVDSDILRQSNAFPIQSQLGYWGRGRAIHHPHCREASYMDFVRKELSLHEKKSFKRDICEAIRDLYTDFGSHRAPFKVYVGPYNGFASGPNSSSQDSVDYIEVHPITFSYPAHLMTSSVVPAKSKAFCSVIPGNLSTYIETEENYYKELANSAFTFTYKKEGWDCVR